MKDDTEATTDEQILAEARDRFEQSSSADGQNRLNALDDIRFLWNDENYQWPAEAQKVREGRPMLVENRLPQFVRQVVNEQRRNRPAISVLPFDDKGDPDTANILEGIIRHIEQYSRADMAYDCATWYAVASSQGYFRIDTEYGDGFDQEICIKPIDNPLTVYDDYYTTMPDKSDRRFCFVAEMVKRPEFKAKYGFEPTPFDEARAAGDNLQEWFDEDSVRVAEYWRVVTEKRKIYRMPDGTVLSEEERKQYGEMLKNQGLPDVEPEAERELEEKKVEQYLITGDRIIRKSEWAGKYIPIVYVGGEECVIEGRRVRKSLIRDAKDAQRAINYYESAKAEVIALTPKAPWLGPTGAFETDKDKWETANVKNYAYLQFDGQASPQRQQFIAIPAGLMEAKMQAIEAQKAIMGLYDASLGARSNETSGVAIEARKREGDTQTFHFIDNLIRAIRYAGLVLVDLIPKIYDASRVVRILGKEGEAEMAQINSLYGPQLDAGKYDVIVKAGPNIESQRQESRQTWIELAKVLPQMTQVAPDLLASLMDDEKADEIAKRLKATIPPQILGADDTPIPPEIQQAMQQAQGMMQQAQQVGQMAQQAIQAAQQEQAKVEADKAKLDAARQALQADTKVLQSRFEELSAKIELLAMQKLVPVPEQIPDGPDVNAIRPEPAQAGFFTPEVTQ